MSPSGVESFRVSFRGNAMDGVFDWAKVLVERVCGSVSLAEAANDLKMSRELLIRWHEMGPLPLFMRRGKPGDGKPGSKGYRMAKPILALLKLVLEWARTQAKRGGFDVTPNDGSQPVDARRLDGTAAHKPTEDRPPGEPIWGPDGKPAGTMAVPPAAPTNGGPRCPCQAGRAAARRKGHWRPAGRFRRKPKPRAAP
jgi:hypothetical protein